MTEFCGCNNPNIVSEEKGSSVVVTCLNCGESIATTNTKIFQEHPWLTDSTEYQILLVPDDMEKAAYIRILNTIANMPVSLAATNYAKKIETVLFKGYGKEFYDMVQKLASQKANFIIRPECGYIKSI